MKKTALAAGAVTILAQGAGIATSESGSGSSTPAHTHTLLMATGYTPDRTHRWRYQYCACGYKGPTILSPVVPDP